MPIVVPKIGKIIFLLIVIVIVISVINPFVIVSAGERGVVLNWGAVSDKVLGEGLHLVIPLQQKVISIDVKTKKIETDSVAYSRDIQTVTTRIALNYHVDASTVNKLYQEVGLNYEDKIIQPAIQESVKATAANFTAQELIEERPKVKEEIKNFIKERLLIWRIVVDEFSIANLDFSDAYERAVEQKQVAQQDALRAKNDLERVKMEAEQRVAQATAEAEAIKIQAQAITQQGGKDYVQLKAIEKWDGKLPAQMIPGGTVPFIEL